VSTQQRSADLAWEVAPDWEHQLIGPEGACVVQWLEAGQGRVVKHGAHRTVYRIDLGQRTLFVKHYRCQPWVGIWRHLLQASHSRREWRKALEVARRRIPTARPVAVGEQKQGWLIRDNYYVCEGIPQAQSLDDYVRDVLPSLPAAERSIRRRQIITSLARLAAAAHASGIDHNDFHTGNILIRAASPDVPLELYLIDLPGIRLSGPLDWPRSRDSLAMLGGAWLERLSRADRWRFWRTYLAERWDASFPSGASAEILQRTQAHAHRVAAARDKRCLRSNRDFQRLQTPGVVAHALKEFSPDLLAALAEDPARPLRVHRHEPVKISHASLLVRASLPVGGQAVRVAYKRSRVRSWWKQLLGGLRRSRALAAWHTGHALLARGISTARPLAVVEAKLFQGRGRGESFLATAWIEGALNLHLYGWELAGRDPHGRHRRACQAAESLGRLLGRMHAWRISHGDLKGCNLVVCEQADGVSAHLIDLDSVRFHRRMSPSQPARDLARLAASMEAHPWLSRTVRLRFLRAYLHGSGRDWKPLWRDIARRTSPILARFQRAGRPVA
jgi:tRNA A-37 threonylcarbamoyl transferase component Bud32